MLGGNRERLLARCAEYVANGKTERVLYIAASHPLLDLATDHILSGTNCNGVWGEFPFYLFRGFVRRVLSEARPPGPQPGSPDGVDRLGNPDASGLFTHGLPTQLAPRIPIDREELPLRRSLISQIIKQLADAGKIPAIKRLANRDGCVNTIASLIGELQRAGKTAAEFQSVVESRAHEDATETQGHRDNAKDKSKDGPQASLRTQSDFDREVALIYSKYRGALDRSGLTDDDADQLRALQILRGDVAQIVNLRSRKNPQGNNLRYALPWLDDLELLVLDGFFDFTPVQGEMLRQLIPAVPNVIVNLNYDAHNEQIFQPFQSTIEQLKSIADFETVTPETARGDLRARLFNVAQIADARAKMSENKSTQTKNLQYTLFECADREVEVRSMNKKSTTKLVAVLIGVAKSDAVKCSLSTKTRAPASNSAGTMKNVAIATKTPAYRDSK